MVHTYQYEMSYSSDSCTKEVPDHLKDVMQLDCVVKEVPGDGACLFTSTSLFIKESHRFIVKNWNHYEVAVERSAWRTDIKTYKDLKKFLLSDSSLYCFSNSSLDLRNLANMFDMRIAIFTYSSGGSVVPHWTWDLTRLSAPKVKTEISCGSRKCGCSMKMIVIMTCWLLDQFLTPSQGLLLIFLCLPVLLWLLLTHSQARAG
jgi:hypothetical protein